MDPSFLNSLPSKIPDPAAMSFVSPNVVFSHQQQQQPAPTVPVPTLPFGNSHLATNLPYGSPLGLSNVNSVPYNLNHVPQPQQQQQPTAAAAAPQPPPPQQQQWSQNIPTIMPWSTPTAHVDNGSLPTVDDNKFSFASTSPSILNNQSNHHHHHIPLVSDNYKSSSAICDPHPSSPSPSPSPSNHNLNTNKNKRHFHQLMSETADFEFDFDNSRPIKKYVCEDKVLEIFDRLHIREGEHYIVEDVVENNGSTIQSPTKNSNHHDLCIEEIDCNTEALIELSPELKTVFKNNPQSLTDKFIVSEQDKINKALVVWKPNDLHKLIAGDGVHCPSTSTSCQPDCDVDDDGGDLDVRIEEALTDDDDDEPQNDGMMSEFISNGTAQIEPYQEFQDQPME